ncbi:MAG: roadblock/LC7 domain-containing protein [Candidatus Helarchaeota archaeon]
MELKSDNILSIINELKQFSTNVEGISIVSSEGLTIYSNIRAGIEDEKVGVMSATLVSIGMNAIYSFNKGNFKSTFIKGEKGYILLGEINQQIVIMIITGLNVKLGVLLWELEKVKKKLAEVLC